ncbi:MAG: lysine exporter LysO family protein [Bacteroidales bacterium]|nr:lysine exporter LysO family protein [Bacteroidales bacterium]
MKGSLIIVGFFILGIAAGLSGMVPESIIDGDLTFYALCALLLCVGIGIGSDRNIVTKFKSLDVRMALLPLGTALGTFAGSLVVSFILSGRSPLDCLAVGSGFGYYSLSSIFITEYKGAELGTIALLANIIREMVTLLLSPVLAKVFGPLAPISSGGVTSMDTTLPIIMASSGEQYSAVSIFHGFILDFSIPFLVTFWCTL